MLTLDRTNTSMIGQWWWTIDRWTLAAIMILVFLGMLLILAASPAVAEQHHWSSFHFVKKHFIFLLPTLSILLGTSFLSIKDIKLISILVLGLSFIGLLLTLVMGVEIKGATRWIDFGGVSLQPSEFAKPCFAIISAWFFAKQQDEPDYPGNLYAIGLYAAFVGLLLLQPDLGMTVLVTTTWFAQFFLAGLPMIWILLAGGCGILSLFGAYLFFPHVTRRVDHFLNPTPGDKFGDRYQIHQSLEAFMNGGFFGQGPGEGTVKKYLPDAHADFIFAVAGEEFGIILCCLLVGLFAFVLLRSFGRLLDETNLFIVLAVTGLIVQFGLQAIINMASTLSLMPTKGMTLPFISYGGSSLLAQALGMGFVLALTRKRILNND